MSNTVRLEVTMREVRLAEVLRDEWWFHEGRWHIMGYDDTDDPLPPPEEKVLVQIPRGLKTLMANESARREGEPNAAP